jgi:cysteamine dioxygenase
MDDYDRRQFIKTTVPGLLGVMLSLPSLCAMATRANAYDGRPKADQSMHWEAFLEAVAKEAAKQHLDRWNEEEYLLKISRLTQSLYLEDPVISLAMEKISERLKKGWVDFHYLEQNVDFAVCMLQFDVGEQIKPHNHPGMTGVILCASGEIQAQNYDLYKTIEENEADGVRSGKYLLHQSMDATLRKGQLSTLTSQARNIHTLKASKVTQLIDIFTPPYNKERSEKSCWYELDEAPVAGSKTIYEARLRE